MARLVSGFVAAMLAWGLVGTTALAKDEVWVPVENKANCAVWDSPPDPGETVTWTGECADGKAEGKGDQKKLLGGKGAGLAEMTRIGLPVPGGFTITTEACDAYNGQAQHWPKGLDKEVRLMIARLQHDIAQCAVGDVQPTIRTETEGIRPADSCRANQCVSSGNGDSGGVSVPFPPGANCGNAPTPPSASGSINNRC